MSNKTILVTGGAGFIGTNFIYHTLSVKPDWRIVNLDSLTYAGNYTNFLDLPANSANRHDFVRGDVRDSRLIEKLFRDYNFDNVIHFAAESHVDRSIYGPEVFLETNVRGTFCLLEASLKHWKEMDHQELFKFIHISTDEVYGSLESDGFFSEETAYDPSSPYSASKAASDHFVKAYFRTYGLPTIITNCSNNFGPYQFPEKLIPLMILNIAEDKPLHVYGDGKNIRDWIYVIDHCNALIRVIENGKAGESYNIGGNEERENIEIVNLLCDMIDDRLGRSPEKSSRRLIRFIEDRPGHDRRYAIDDSKIRKDLGWEPEQNFEMALKFTVEWYLNHTEWVESVRTGKYREWLEKNYRDRASYPVGEQTKK